MEKMVLIVDDSATVRQQVAMTLRQAGFATTQATDGREGLAALDADRSIAMVICDVNMPNMGGLEMVAQVKKKAEFKALPILMLTTEGHPSLVKQAKDAGAVGWVVKPFDAALLVKTVQHLTKS
jgi:two-component system, chemotaxis family, chemotaxis protein CheY